MDLENRLRLYIDDISKIIKNESCDISPDSLLLIELLKTVRDNLNDILNKYS